MSKKRISPTLVQEAQSVCCAVCGHPVGTAGQPWKVNAKLTTVAAASVPGAGSAVHPAVVIRHFACPQCGSLLDSELALPEDPYLNDLVFP
jgi:acetone carboxylase gamma subunit